jgi:hypothetical protein
VDHVNGSSLAQNRRHSTLPCQSHRCSYYRMKTSRVLLLLALLSASLAFGQTTPSGIAGETSVSLDVGFGVRAVAPSRVSVPTGELLRISAPRLSGDVQYIWLKNGRAIPGETASTLVLNHVVSTDAGTYMCIFSTPNTTPGASQALILGVGPTDRLLNLSTRAVVGGANAPLISGFVVGGGAREKMLIVRAIGPSLSLFGETSPLRAPVLRIYDSTGALSRRRGRPNVRERSGGFPRPRRRLPRPRRFA